MRNERLKYLGMIMTVFGGIVASGGIYMGVAPQYHSSISAQGTTITIGAILLLVGLLMWIFIDE